MAAAMAPMPARHFRSTIDATCTLPRSINMKIPAAHISRSWPPIAARSADPEVPAEHWMEHRWGRRRPCQARVSVSTSAGASGFGQLRNLSMSGAFLDTAVSLPLYAQLSIAVLRNDGARHRLEFSAVVVRHDANGVGIEWCEPYPGSICEALHCDIDCVQRKECTHSRQTSSVS